MESLLTFSIRCWRLTRQPPQTDETCRGGTKRRPHPEERRFSGASRRMERVSAWAILRDGRASKSAVADFDTLTLPKSGKPDFGARPPQDEVRWRKHAPSPPNLPCDLDHEPQLRPLLLL